jgi:hypothetical protein
MQGCADLQLLRAVTTVEHNHDWCVALEKKLNESSVTNVNLLCHPVDWQSPGTRAYPSTSRTHCDQCVTVNVNPLRTQA